MAASPPPSWLAEQWFNLVQTIGIISSLLFTAYQARRASKESRLSYMLAVTEAHRDIWSRLFDKPELGRIREQSLDLETAPVTTSERQFVIFLILHLQCVLALSHSSMIVPIEGLKADVAEFFSFPIPRRVWGEVGYLQNKDLIFFIETAAEKFPKTDHLLSFT